MVAAPGRIGDPAEGQAARAAELDHAILVMAVAAVGLLDRLTQARVGHAVENVTDALRMVFAQDGEDLLVENIRGDGGFGGRALSCGNDSGGRRQV